MQQNNHAPESWRVALKEGSTEFGMGQTHVYDKDGRYLGTFLCHESAKRAAVCVNACTGIPTEALDGRRISWCVYSDIPQKEESHDTQ